MRPFEHLEGVLKEQNLEEIIRCVSNHIDSCKKYESDVRAVSLMTIRDALDKKFTNSMLRDQGYILTIAQFTEDCKKFLALSAEDPISFNSHLKRLHRGFVALKLNYIENKVSNHAVLSEMKEHFATVILDCYTNGSSDGSKMPEGLSKEIALLIQAEVEALKGKWFSNTLLKDYKEEFSTLLSAQLLSDWTKGILPTLISKQLEAEKEEMNSVKALMGCLHQNKLPKEIQDKIMASVITEISDEINAAKIQPNSPLGAAFRTIREESLQNSNYSIISRLIQKWQNDKVTNEVLPGLEKYITRVIDKLKPSLEASLTKEFEQISVHVFLGKLQTGKYLLNLSEAMNKYASEIVKNAFLYNQGTNSVDLPKCRAVVSSAAMGALQGLWLSGKLAEKEVDFIKNAIFAPLQELDEKIQQRVWSNGTTHAISNLVTENKNLRSEVTDLRAEFVRLSSMMEKLVLSKQDNSENAASAASPRFFSAMK